MRTAAAARILVSAMVLLAGGCAGILPGQGVAPDLYTLSPKSTYAKDLPSASWQLVIEVPVTAESLNTLRIALRHDPLTLDYYKNVRWTERAPVMVQTLLIESFENTGKIVAVARKATDLRADFVLKTDLREFQAEYDDAGPPFAHVRVNAKLVKLPQRTIIASHTAERRLRAKGNDMRQIIYAFDGALGGTLKTIVEWALRVPK